MTESTVDSAPDGALREPHAALTESRARAGRAIRDLGHALVGHHETAEEIDGLTADLERWTRRLADGPERNRVIERPTGDWGPPPPDGEEMFSFDERPVSGRASPYGLDLRVVRDGDEVVAHVTLRAGHEGAPGRSHGGIVSALFDDVFGFVLTLHRVPAFTGELTIRYERGVPLRAPLECRVRMTGRDGRKIHMEGELTGPGGDNGRSDRDGYEDGDEDGDGDGDEDGDGDGKISRTVYTRAAATFIAIDPELFRAAAE